MVVVPGATDVTLPTVTVATEPSDEVHVAVAESSLVDPSLNVAVAVNASVCPTA